MTEFRGLMFTAIAACFALSSSAPTPARAARKSVHWAQWRGSDGSGVSAETRMALDWGVDRNIRWKTPIPGRGHSSPVVWGSRVYLTTDLEGDVVSGAQAVTHILEGKQFKHPDSVGGDRHHSFRVLCLDRDSGRVMWEKTAYEGTVYDDRHRKGSYAASTPATDGNYVYAWFGTEGVYCYDRDGRQAWKAAPGPIATVGMGPGASPVLHGKSVILLCDEDEGTKSFIVALDRATGKELWRTPRKVQASWATPVLARAGSRTELVCSGNERIISYDPATGKELWSAKGHGSNAIPSPVAGRDMVFVSAGFPVKKTYGIKLGASGDISDTPNIAWQYDKGTAYVPSTILYGDYLYLMTDRGILTCIDALTGAVKYDNGRIPVPATFTASPVALDNRILITSEDGDTYVIKAGPVHEIMATNSVGEPVYASPAIADGMIFIRGEKHLFCVAGKGR